MPSPATPYIAARPRTVVRVQTRWPSVGALAIASTSLLRRRQLPHALKKSSSEGRLLRPAGEDLLALQLVQAAPDAVRLTDADGVVEALPLHRTGGANALGP